MQCNGKADVPTPGSNVDALALKLNRLLRQRQIARDELPKHHNLTATTTVTAETHGNENMVCINRDHAIVCTVPYSKVLKWGNSVDSNDPSVQS